ncbi:heparinase II/III family protein [Paenibacillus harenae]|uniref:heparinase II/III family protein n=1 Tax=Paenibacillus harenae TaxID=306543 RepID=UPI0004025359|nr:heparinase II/III family protein [Paenibacillus harenae]
MKLERIKQLLDQKRRRGLSLLTDDRTIAELRARLLQTTANRSLIGEIQAEAQRMIGESDPDLTYSLFRIYVDTGERLAYQRVYFEKRKRLNAFAVMSLLEPDNTTYLEALHNTVWSICNEFTWCLPAHFNEANQTEIDLFAAETGFALSEVLLLAEETLPALLRRRIKEEVERRLFRPFLEEGTYRWEKEEHNWAAVCAGSIGAAALHLIDDEARLARILERVTDALDCYLSGFGDDGVCAEGYLYWQYGFGYYVYFAQLLKAATDGEIDLFTPGKVKEIALFQQKCFTSGNRIVNFSDAPSESGIFMGLSSLLHDEYEEVAMPDASLRASYSEDHCGRWAPAIRNLIWPKEAEDRLFGHADGHHHVWPAESYYLPDAQWLLSRHLTDDGGCYSFAAKGGHNNEPHNHNDVGHFLIHADGDVYLADLGSGMYTSRYFGPERYSLWCNGSQGHSVPIIAGAYQQSGGSYRAEVINAAADERYDQIDMDLSGAYPDGLLAQLKRRLLWSKDGIPSLALTDTIVFAADRTDRTPCTVTERFITFLTPELAKEGRIVLNGKRKLGIYYDYLAWEPLITSRSDIDHYGQERSWYTLDFSPVAETSERVTGHFIFQFES